MPYCDEHNEVYSGPECPACAGETDADAESAGNPDGGSDSLGDVVNEAVGAARDAVDAVESDGDVVVGDQQKNVDRSTTVVDDSTEVHDRSTTVDDSIVQGSSIGAGEGNGEGRTVVDDSVVKDSEVGGDGKTDVEDSVLGDATVGGEHVESAVGDRSAAAPDPESKPEPKPDPDPDPDPTENDDSAFCIYCGTEIPATAGFCPTCGEEQ
jgi:hypothetical protein